MLYGYLERPLAGRGNGGRIDCFAAASGRGFHRRAGWVGVREGAGRAAAPAVAVSSCGVGVVWQDPARAVVLDARRGEVYNAITIPRGAWVAEVVAKFPVWLDMLPAGVTEFVATDFAPYLGQLAGTRFEGASVVTAPRALATAIALLRRRGPRRGSRWMRPEAVGRGAVLEGPGGVRPVGHVLSTRYFPLDCDHIMDHNSTRS